MVFLMLSGSAGTVFAGKGCTTGNKEKIKIPQAKVAKTDDEINLSETTKLLCSDEGSDEESDVSSESTEELDSETESESCFSDSDENCTTNKFYECAKMAYDLGVKLFEKAQGTDDLFVKSNCNRLGRILHVFSEIFNYAPKDTSSLSKTKNTDGEDVVDSPEGQKKVSSIVESLKDDIILLGDKFIETSEKNDFDRLSDAYVVAERLFSILVDMNIKDGVQKIYECGLKYKALVKQTGLLVYERCAISCFTRAADKDFMLACFELGKLLEREDILKALVYYDKASRLGCKEAELYAFFACLKFKRANGCGFSLSTKCAIYYRLGLSHEQGRGGANTDVLVTLNCYLKSINCCDKCATVKVQNECAIEEAHARKKVQSVRDELRDFDVSKIKFRKSTPEEIDEVERAIELEAVGKIDEAVSVYMNLGKQGCLRAQERLAYCFQNNLIPNSSLLETVVWFKRAALNGSLYSKIVILGLKDLFETVKD